MKSDSFLGRWKSFLRMETIYQIQGCRKYWNRNPCNFQHFHFHCFIENIQNPNNSSNQCTHKSNLSISYFQNYQVPNYVLIGIQYSNPITTISIGPIPFSFIFCTVPNHKRNSETSCSIKDSSRWKQRDVKSLNSRWASYAYLPSYWHIMASNTSVMSW